MFCDTFLAIDFVLRSMKGDLSTLKKVCRYASVVMLIGEIIFAMLFIATLIMGISTFITDVWKDALFEWIGVNGSDGTVKIVSAFIVTLMIIALAFITVGMVREIMVSIKTEYTPFIPENAKRIKTISMAFLFSSVFLLLFGFLAGKGITELLFMFFGSLMVAVVMYCLTIVCRYGVLLQKESDETL